jgi:hypothetical protein
MKTLFTIKYLFGVSVLISILSLFFYYRYTCSPEYSLGKIVETYKDHNLNEFNKYVDTKNSISNVLNDFLISLESLSYGRSLLIFLLNETNPFFITRPHIEESCLKVINSCVENGVDTNLLNIIVPGAGNINNKEIWDSIRTSNQCVYKGIKDTKIDGKVATISLELYQKRYDTTLTFNVKMRDMDGYWQLFDISGITNYLNVGKNLESNYIKSMVDSVGSPYVDASTYWFVFMIPITK